MKAIDLSALVKVLQRIKADGAGSILVAYDGETKTLNAAIADMENRFVDNPAVTQDIKAAIDALDEKLSAKIDGKVDSVDGKGLSTCDFTAELKDKLTEIQSVTTEQISAWNAKQDALTFDSAPTESSGNPVTSGGVYDALALKQDSLSFDDAPTYNSGNVLTSHVIKNALDSKAEVSHTHDAADVGLGNVDNTADVDKPISDATQSALDAVSETISLHTANTDNPHSVTAEQLGLGNVNNTSDADKPVSTATQSAINTVKATLTSHVGDTTNPHSVTAAQVGLGNVDNTADVDKPISTAVQSALDAKQDTLTFDTEPTYQSTNPVTSSGVCVAIEDLEELLLQNYIRGASFEVETSGDGNAITSLEYPDEYGVFYATKGETFVTQAALDAKIVLSESEPTTQNTGDLWLKLTS